MELPIFILFFMPKMSLILGNFKVTIILDNLFISTKSAQLLVEILSAYEGNTSPLRTRHVKNLIGYF